MEFFEKKADLGAFGFRKRLERLGRKPATNSKEFKGGFNPENDAGGMGADGVQGFANPKNFVVPFLGEGGVSGLYRFKEGDVEAWEEVGTTVDPAVAAEVEAVEEAFLGADQGGPIGPMGEEG